MSLFVFCRKAWFQIHLESYSLHVKSIRVNEYSDSQFVAQ
jgi:hypothetical protein